MIFFHLRLPLLPSALPFPFGMYAAAGLPPWPPPGDASFFGTPLPRFFLALIWAFVKRVARTWVCHCSACCCWHVSVFVRLCSCLCVPACLRLCLCVRVPSKILLVRAGGDPVLLPPYPSFALCVFFLSFVPSSSLLWLLCFLSGAHWH